MGISGQTCMLDMLAPLTLWTCSGSVLNIYLSIEVSNLIYFIQPCSTYLVLRRATTYIMAGWDLLLVSQLTLLGSDTARLPERVVAFAVFLMASPCSWSDAARSQQGLDDVSTSGSMSSTMLCVNDNCWHQARTVKWCRA